MYERATTHIRKNDRNFKVKNSSQVFKVVVHLPVCYEVAVSGIFRSYVCDSRASEIVPLIKAAFANVVPSFMTVFISAIIVSF